MATTLLAVIFNCPERNEDRIQRTKRPKKKKTKLKHETTLRV